MDEIQIDDRKLGTCMDRETTSHYLTIYRACAMDVKTFSGKKDYVTFSKRFAVEHGEHMHAVHKEPYHVIRALVQTKHVFNAYNPGEYFYFGPEKKGYEIYVTKGDDFEGYEESRLLGREAAYALLRESNGITFYHGTPDNRLTGSHGIHVGTLKAATQALEARIGVPAEGTWDGTREYGKTLLAGEKRLGELEKERGYFLKTGHNCRNVPEENYYPGDRDIRAKYSNGSEVPMDCKPVIFKVEIAGPMSNGVNSPHSDQVANGLMMRGLRKGNAKRGFYYTNIGEDEGSVSAVVPDKSFLRIVESASNDVLSAANLYATFDKVNVECFDGSLRRIPIEVSSSKSYTGIFRAKATRDPFGRRTFTDMRIAISNFFKMDGEKLKNIMAHEMIHYWVAMNHPGARESHGWEFSSTMRRINGLSLGYNVTMRDDETPELNGAKPVKSDHIFAVGKHRGKIAYVIVLAKDVQAQLAEIKDFVEKYKMDDMKYYTTRSPHIHALRIAKNPTKFGVFGEEHRSLIDNILSDPTTVPIP